MRSLGAARALAIALAITVLVVAGGWFIQVRTPVAVPAPLAIEPIESSVLICPEPGANPELGVRVTAAVVPGQRGQDTGPGSARLETLPGKSSAEASIIGPGGQVQIDAFGEKLPPIRAVALGSLAPGFVADQWGRDPRGTGRGLASTACAPAASRFWFVGGGSVTGRQTRVVLVNPDENAAVVDVLIYGTGGLLDAPGGRGLVVPPGARLVVRLDALIPGEKSTAFQVIARTGRIGAAIDDQQMSGLKSVGADWIAPAAVPATTVYVPGVLPGKGARVLSVVAPGDQDAVVKIRIISSIGTFSPVERDTLKVPAGTVISVDMSLVTAEQPVTLELTSDQPIVAGMRQFFSGTKQQDDTSFTSGAQPFTGPAAVSGLPVRTATDVRLAITAPLGAVSVDIVLLPYRGQKQIAEATVPRRIDVPAGQVKFILLRPPAGIDWYTAVVTPTGDSGPVLLAHRVRERSRYGDLITGYPWPPLRTEVTVPAAEQDSGVTVR
ncbi:MAG: DUF5719 family protein [Actinomycetota bacterium]|nr:DUF5719 family protein [Actinomycetota bacterium]